MGPAAGERPPVDPAFGWLDDGWGPGLRCIPLSAAAQHVFTVRQPELPGADAPVRDARWTAAATALGVHAGLFRVTQVHGRTVRVVRPGDDAQARPEADALVSDVAGAGLLVQVADCVPILVVDPVVGAAAAVHAGWRGTCARVTRAAVEALTAEYGCRPADMMAAIGPSIGPDDYEVGDAVLEAFADAGHAGTTRWFRRTGERGALHLDLWEANLDQLTACGIAPGAVHVSRLSTAPNPVWLDSYRRDGPAAGRMAGIVRVPAAAPRG
ncbi:MAG: polyphenol oxidase family protein [Vicinamibacterales bacterium]